MNVFKAIAALAVWACFAPGHAADAAAPGTSAPPAAAQQAYDRLIAVKQFAFGGVGFAGTTSEGEKAFRTILASPNALRLFRLALSKGSTEAKLYALSGFRQLDQRSFDTESKALVEANPEATTMSGCIVRHEQAAAVVKRIADGMYDGAGLLE